MLYRERQGTRFQRVVNAGQMCLGTENLIQNLFLYLLLGNSL